MPREAEKLDLRFQRNLRGADLRNADLRDADLSGADLYGADLSGADLSGADLSDADLSDADLSGATLSGADLSGANLNGAKYNTRTSFPEGTSPDSLGMIFTTLGVKSKFISIDSEYGLLYMGSSSEIFIDIINDEFQANHKKHIPLNEDVNNDHTSNFLSNQSEDFLTNIKNVIYRASIPSLTEIILHVYQENQYTFYSSSINAETNEIEDFTFVGSIPIDFLSHLSELDLKRMTDDMQANWFILFKNVNPNIVIKFIKRTTI